MARHAINCTYYLLWDCNPQLAASDEFYSERTANPEGQTPYKEISQIPPCKIYIFFKIRSASQSTCLTLHQSPFFRLRHEATHIDIASP
jgi:hypothetical protein